MDVKGTTLLRCGTKTKTNGIFVILVMLCRCWLLLRFCLFVLYCLFVVVVVVLLLLLLLFCLFVVVFSFMGWLILPKY